MKTIIYANKRQVHLPPEPETVPAYCATCDATTPHTERTRYGLRVLRCIYCALEQPAVQPNTEGQYKYWER